MSKMSFAEKLRVLFKGNKNSDEFFEDLTDRLFGAFWAITKL